MNTLPALLPVARIWDIPFDAEEVDPLWSYSPVVGTPLRDWIPPECGRVLLVVNGTALMQAEWVRPVLLGDRIEWHLLPCGGGSNENKGTSRQVLTIIAAIVIAYFTAGYDGGATTKAFLAIALNLAAQVIINAIIPIKALDVNANSATSVYNIALSANSARLNQPIPVIYGRMRTFPDFAAQPYAYYVDNNQYYAALFCIGQGSFSVERVQIDDTNIRNFDDVKYRILAPGAAPTLVNSNVVTVPEIAGQELKAGVYTPGFTVCAAGYTVDKIEVDLVMEQGIGYMENSGSITPFPLDMRLGVRYIDDFGVPTSGWADVLTPNITGATRTPVRKTFSVAISPPGRVEVRMARTTLLYTDNHYVNTVNWASMRGFIVSAGTPLHAGATHLEVLMKASEQLTGLNQRKINVIVRRKLPSWIESPPGTFVQQAATETRSIAWALADIWLNQDYGARQALSTADMKTLIALDAVWAARQDRCDILFDSRSTVREALKIVAQTGRAVAYQRMGMMTVARDQMQTLPVTGFSSRNILPGSVSITYALPTPETADAVVIEYFDNRIWDWVPITCNVPGVTTPVNPVTIRVAGITGAYQARREGLYKAADNLYRRKFPKWETEMLGRLPTYGSAVLFAPAMPTWAQSGDVVDNSGLNVMLSEPVTFTPGVTHYISFMGPYGDYGAAIIATPGADANTVVLASAPANPLLYADANSERTRYIFGVQSQSKMTVRLLSTTYKGYSDSGPIVELAGVAEDTRVHEADNAYLPAGGVIQDPVSTDIAGDLDNPPVGSGTGGGSGADPFYVIDLPTQSRAVTVIVGEPPASVSFVFHNDGSMTGGGTDSEAHPFWMLYGTVSPSIAARYEIRAVPTPETAFSPPLTLPAMFDSVWRNLGSDQTFTLAVPSNSGNVDGGTGTLLVGYFEIRDVATHTVQDTSPFVFSITFITL